MSSALPVAEIVTDDPAVWLRRAGPADDAFVQALFDDVRAEPFLRGGLSGAMLRRLLDQQFRIQRESYARQFPDASALIVEKHGTSVGRLLLDCRDRRWHVIDFALIAACRGQGVGTRVMRGVEAAARAQGVHAFTLMVLETNAAACRLYARLGFAQAGPHAGDGYLAMTRQLDR